MSHPEGGFGKYFNPVHTFEQAYEYVGKRQLSIKSTTGEHIVAKQGRTKDGIATLVFTGEEKSHCNVCHACWGYRSNCSEQRIGHCTEALDKQMP